MKEHMQTVINVCLAIFITVFIYQNNKQQQMIESLAEDTKSTLDVIVIEQQKLDINQLKEDRDKFQVAILENFDDINNLRENLKNNIDVNNNNFRVVKDAHIKKSEELLDAIKGVNKARLSVDDVMTIIESCKTRKTFLNQTHDHDLLCRRR
tara:strand:- start:53 stop:508 length:456 start_codon:yes stop_codon:yes gene_type:complete